MHIWLREQEVRAVASYELLRILVTGELDTLLVIATFIFFKKMGRLR
jgi:hypothetical protein